MADYVGIVGNNYVPNTNTSTTASAANSQTILNDNFDTFVNILTAQLKSQDPLDPMDATSFTDQLVQFSGVEQAIKTNEKLEEMTQILQSNMSNAVSYLGKKATIDTSSSALTNGNAQWQFDVEENAKASIVISDNNGQIVHSADVYLPSGSQEYNWNGLDDTGVAMPDGLYTIAISARDDANQHVNVSTTATGLITALDMSTADPKVTINGKSVSLSSITRLEV